MIAGLKRTPSATPKRVKQKKARIKAILLWRVAVLI